MSLSRATASQGLAVLLMSAAALGAGLRTLPSLTDDHAQEFEGLFLPSREVEVSSATQGLLKSLSVDVGDRVQAGQVLATLDDRVERVGVTIAQARADFEAGLRVAEQQHELSERRYEQHKALFEEGIISAEKNEQVLTEREIARLEVCQEQEARQLAELEVLRTRTLLDQRLVRSTIDGVVVERLLSPGELVSPSNGDVIVKLVQLDPLRIDVRLPVSMHGRIAPGMEAAVRPEAPHECQLRALVEVVDPVVDARSATFRVRLTLPNADHGLPAGLRCRVSF